MAPWTPPLAMYASTVKRLPSRRFQVSSIAVDRSGSTPGAPVDSSTARSTRSPSTVTPARCVGSSIAAVDFSLADIGPTR